MTSHRSTVLALSTLSLLASATTAQQPSLRVHHEPLPSGGASIAAGDLDGDGDLDGVGSTISANLLFLNRGDGVFLDATSNLPATDTGSSAAVVVDVDDDGDLDIATVSTSFSTPQNQLHINDGSAVFTDATSQLPVESNRGAVIRAADLDDDGDEDLWIGNFGADQLWLNDGAGTFTNTPGLIPVLTGGTQVELADIDGDDDVDALWVSEFDGYTLLLNDGAGTFSDVSGQLPFAGGPIQRAGFGDFDGILGPDVWAADFGSSAVYLNDGAGSFTLLAGSTLTHASPPTAHAVLEATGDSAIDLVVGFGVDEIFGTGGGSSLFVGSASGLLTESPGAIPFVPGDPGHFFAADVDADGDADLWNRNRLFLSNGAGLFGLGGGTYPTVGSGARPVGDVNSDGWLDVFASDSSIWLGDGTAFFTEWGGTLPPAPYGNSGAAFGDVDGDGHADLLLVNQVDGDDPNAPNLIQDAQLWLGDGGTSFANATATNLPVFIGEDRGITHTIVLADVDGDADLDAIVADYNDFDGGGGGVQVWANDGAGVFVVTNQPALSFNEADKIAVGDVDGDGDPDLVVGEWPSTVHLMLNDGAGTFTSAPSQIPTLALGQTMTLALEDLDGDTDLDIMVVRERYNGSFDDVFGVWKNNGSGDFTDSGAPLQSIRSYQLADLDNDGDLDLVHPSELLVNDGTGAFSSSAFVVPVTSLSANYLDVDGDGDIDVLDAARVVSGTERHVAWSRLPSLGKSVTMELSGPPSGAWILMAGTARLASAVPTTLGNLLLDPVSLIEVVGGAFDVSGEAQIAFPAPSNPALAGFTVWWQGVVALPAAFTNLEPTTLTPF